MLAGQRPGQPATCGWRPAQQRLQGRVGLDAGTVPAPVAISDPTTIATDGADAEQYEGVLVTVSDVAVTTATDAYGQFIVDSSLMVGSLFFTDFLEPAVSTTYTTITGPLHFTFDDFKLEPRTAADLVD